MLADVGAGAALGRDHPATQALLVADDAQLGGAHAARQVHVEHSAQLLQQLREQGTMWSAAVVPTATSQLAGCMCSM